MPDVNILIYAHRADEKVHEPYKQWLTDLVGGAQPFALSVLVAVGFVRIVTNERVYRTPTPLPLALAVIDQLATHPHCRLVAPAADHWLRVSDLCRRTGAVGKLVADAQHAAIALAEGCTWVTRDGDFSRFGSCGLLWQHLVFSERDSGQELVDGHGR